MLRISGRNFCLSAKEKKKQRMGVPETQVFVRLRFAIQKLFGCSSCVPPLGTQEATKL
jgi:hypothetical protein